MRTVDDMFEIIASTVHEKVPSEILEQITRLTPEELQMLQARIWDLFYQKTGQSAGELPNDI